MSDEKISKNFIYCSFWRTLNMLCIFNETKYKKCHFVCWKKTNKQMKISKAHSGYEGKAIFFSKTRTEICDKYLHFKEKCVWSNFSKRTRNLEGSFNILSSEFEPVSTHDWNDHTKSNGFWWIFKYSQKFEWNHFTQ